MRNYPHTFSGRTASQSHHELSSFIQLLRSKGVRRYLEIGARHGDTFHEVMSHLEQPCFGLAVDLPGGLWGKNGTQNSLRAAITDLNSKDRLSIMMLGNSQDQKVVDAIKELPKFDAVLIDGDHTLEGVTKDFENYKDMADIIAFHDIVGEGQAEKVKGNKVEVPILWQRLKSEYEHMEFIDEGSKMGIGVIFK